MNKRIPIYLHLPQQILWFDVQELALVILFYIMAITFGGLAYFLIIIGPALTIPLKRRKPRGWMSHQFLAFGYLKIRNYPLPTENTFQE